MLDPRDGKSSTRFLKRTVWYGASLLRGSEYGDIDAHEPTLTVHDDGFRVVKGHQRGTEKYEIDRHLWSPINFVFLGKENR